MFGKKNKKERLSNDSNNYIMPECFDTSNLVVANLEMVTNDEEFPMVSTTDQKYIFEIVTDNDKVRYKEVFTGFITDIEDNCHIFNYPYVVNITSLNEIIPTINKTIPKLSLLIVLNEINKNVKTNKEMDQGKRKSKHK